MNETKKELLMTYIKSNVAPILIDFEFPILDNTVLLSSSCEKEELVGTYNGNLYESPEWLKLIINNNSPSILLIDSIDQITKEEQLKFIEILKYRKVSTFNLPESTIIIVTAKRINESTINEEVYSLVAHIKD